MRTTTAFILFALYAALCGCGQNPSPSAEAIAAFTDAAFKGQTLPVAAALASGMPVDQLGKDGNSALMLAAFNGHTETMHILLDAGADVSLRDSDGRTPLMFAATGPFPVAVRLLLKNGSDVNAIGSTEHFSALMFAAGEGLSPIVDILLDAGADPTLKDIDGDTAASFARQRGFPALADKLDSL